MWVKWRTHSHCLLLLCLYLIQVQARGANTAQWSELQVQVTTRSSATWLSDFNCLELFDLLRRRLDSNIKINCISDLSKLDLCDGGSFSPTTLQQWHWAKCFRHFVFYICLSVCQTLSKATFAENSQFCLVYIKKRVCFDLHLCVLS